MSSSKKRKFQSTDSEENLQDDYQKEKKYTNHNSYCINSSGHSTISDRSSSSTSAATSSISYAEPSNYNNLNVSALSTNVSTNVSTNISNKIQYLVTNMNALHLKFEKLLIKVESIEDELKTLNKSKKEDKQHTEKYQDLIQDMINLNVKSTEKEKKEKKEVAEINKKKDKPKKNQNSKNNKDLEEKNKSKLADTKSEIEKKIKPEILNMYS